MSHRLAREHFEEACRQSSSSRVLMIDGDVQPDSGPFDFVATTNFLSAGDVPRAVERLRGLLATNGRLVLLEPFAGRFRIGAEDEPGGQPLRPTEIDYLAAGFRRVRLRYFTGLGGGAKGSGPGRLLSSIDSCISRPSTARLVGAWVVIDAVDPLLPTSR